jgi:hypothetical protein
LEQTTHGAASTNKQAQGNISGNSCPLEKHTCDMKWKDAIDKYCKQPRHGMVLALHSGLASAEREYQENSDFFAGM